MKAESFALIKKVVTAKLQAAGWRVMGQDDYLAATKHYGLQDAAVYLSPWRNEETSTLSGEYTTRGENVLTSPREYLLGGMSQEALEAQVDGFIEQVESKINGSFHMRIAYPSQLAANARKNASSIAHLI